MGRWPRGGPVEEREDPAALVRTGTAADTVNRTHEERASQHRTQSIPLARPTATAPHVVLATLQRQAGNRAVTRLVASVQRQPSIQKATDWTKPQTNVRGSGITRHEVHGLTFGQKGDFFVGKYECKDKDGNTKLCDSVEKKKTKTSARKMAVVLVPDSFNPKNPIQVILHFHGWGFRPGDQYAGYRPRKDDDTVRDIALDHLEQQIGAVTGGTQIVAILAQGIGKSQFGEIPTFAYVRDVLGKVFGNVPPFSVVLSAHSGGGSTVGEKLKAGEAETADRSRLSTPPRAKQKGVDDSLAPVDLIVLFEALNGKNDVDAVVTWVERQLQRLKPELAKTPTEAATALAATPKLRGYFGSRASKYKTLYTTLHGEIKNKIDTHIPDAWHVRVHDLFRIVEVVNPVEREFKDKDRRGKTKVVRDKRVEHEEVISGGVVKDDKTGTKTQKQKDDAEKQGAMRAALLASVDASSDRAQALPCDKCTATSPAPSKGQNAPAQVPAGATTPRGAGAGSVPPAPAPVQREEAASVGCIAPAGYRHIVGISGRGPALPMRRSAAPRTLAVARPRRTDADHGLHRLQALAGNRAVCQLLAGSSPRAAAVLAMRQTAAVVQRVDGPDVVAPAPKGTDPLSEPRIAWIDKLGNPTLQGTIDASDALKKRAAELRKELTKATGAVAKAGTGKQRDQAKARAATLEAAKTELDGRIASTLYVNRQAFMDYMACSLGGDRGTQEYFESLVEFDAGLNVHPEVARRLDHVKDDLGRAGLPMPRTTVGQSLRGDHTRNTRERNSPGMLAHAMGLAVDWFAYKNVHLTDERLIAVIGAYTGRSHSLDLGPKGLDTIVAMGEASMGAAPKGFDAAAGAALVERVGTEFDLLSAASDRLATSLPVSKDELLGIQNTVFALQRKVTTTNAALAKARRNKRTEAATLAGLQAAAEAAKAELLAKHEELKPRLAQIFDPWLTAIAKKKADLTAAAGGHGVALGDVSTDAALKAARQSVQRGVKPALGDLKRVVADATAAGGGVVKVLREIGWAATHLEERKLPRQATEEDRIRWQPLLTGLQEQGEAALGDADALKAEAALLMASQGRPIARGGQGRRRAFGGDGDLAAWTKGLGQQQARLAGARQLLAAARAKLPKDVAGQATDYADRVRRNEAVLATVKDRAVFERLQEQKKQWYFLDRAGQDLVNDLSFMFKAPDVRDPGVAQLLGFADEKYGGGGFFGTTAKGKANPKSDEAGFNRAFFQRMVTYGFEPAASWHHADTMHFELERLVRLIVPPAECEEPGEEAPLRAKAFVAEAVRSREAWDREHPPPKP